jgi:hypothetical protein
MTETVGSRELAAEVASCHEEKAEDFHRYMPTVQHWIRANLFDAAGVGPVEKNPRRGRSRRFPLEALQWARLFAALTIRGAGVVEIWHVAGHLRGLRQKGVEIDDALAGRGDDVWLVYLNSLPWLHAEQLHLQRGGVQLPFANQHPRGDVVSAVNLTRVFNR